ncbi:MAG: protein serine/threonine phosphatase [Bacteroidetes bacterium]|jgi:serine phosphatase RsbU (regulator of sigma subunit)|nr:protein serine/threonine phosphatase [Bacteroidota bacterium]MDF2452969.1 protein serine/threonine phosphatase [Bacteroidota bacterium]
MHTGFKVRQILISLAFLFFFLKSQKLVSQSHYVDSLINYVKASPADTHKLSVLTRIIEAISEDEVWSGYNDQLGPLAQKLMRTNNAAIKLKAKRHYSDYLNNKGYLSNNIGDITLALDYFHQSLRIQEEVGDKSGQSYSLNNIGYIYNSQKQTGRALAYYQKSFALQKEIGDKHGQAQSLSNIGNIYENKGNLKKALFYYFKGLAIRREINSDKHGVGYSLQNIGNIYFSQKNYFSALYYYTKSLEVRKEINDTKGISYSLCNLSRIHLAQNNTALALKYGNEALMTAQDIGSPENISLASTILEEVYLKEGKFDRAHEMLKLAVKMRDSINNNDIRKSAERKQLQYEFEKKEVISKAEQEKRELTYIAKAKQQRIIIYAIIAGLIICCFFGAFMYNRFKITQRQNIIIQSQKKLVEDQKHVLEAHQKEIVDSINYAKRIQYALLAHEDLFVNNLASHFILFKPKDIVSGDFYWATEHNGNFYLAVCDSTGHGVPGAFMSLLSIGFLSEAIKEKGIEEPNKVFDYVRKRLIESITNENQKDGFDGILLRINKMSNEVTYAAANNHPVVISDGKICHLNCDKMPVGKGERVDEFSLYTLVADTNDTVYLYTDGYADQFGGPKGKKFKYKPLNELLVSLNPLSLSDQQDVLAKTFSQWRGALEQVDDVLIIGIKL